MPVGIKPTGVLRKLQLIIVTVAEGKAVAAAGTHAVGIVGVSPGGCAVRQAGKFPAMLPGIGDVTIGQRVADAIVGDRLTVIAGRKVTPIRIFVGVGMPPGRM